MRSSSPSFTPHWALASTISLFPHQHHQNVDNLLVVAVSRDVADTFAALLQDDATLEVRATYSVDDALRAIRERVPDLVFVDVGPPGIDGRQFAHKIRTIFGGHIRLVAFADSIHHSEAELRASGFNAVVEKPVRLAHLFAVLSEFGVHDPAVTDPARQLERARQHVTQGEQRIERLKAIVQRLNEQGLPSADAQRVLETFLQTQQLMREHLAYEEAHGRARTE